jgi:hypothetical protein
MARRPPVAALLLLLRCCSTTALAPPAREARIIELLGKGRVGLPQSDEVELDELVANLEGQRPTIASVSGDWDLLYTSKSEFDPANPLGRRAAVPKSNVSRLHRLTGLFARRRVDGTAPGIEKIFDVAFSQAEAVASSSPIQRFVTGLESVEIRQVVELDDAGMGRVDQFVEAGENVVFRLSASGSFDEATGRLDFTFDDAYLTAFGVRIPYPVPFRLLGDEASGYLDTRYVSDTLRVSRGNKGTTFILRRR